MEESGRDVDGYGEPCDPWGRAYWCETHRDRLARIGCDGPDGVEGSGDEIVLDVRLP